MMMMAINHDDEEENHAVRGEKRLFSFTRETLNQRCQKRKKELQKVVVIITK